ncbi:hypothetical protein GGI25_000072 [Coemansia spiralis]|uniref:Uncharacterized protein n=2 Tax=Coemansia TaxID=4863 RepID=A0A9W8L1E1_9FUNG|nr:hypothetical protein EDC05_002717 [Coemansia umbellata]KAJ2623049.1 hypothetical protein GGI26_002658 [Coemansia sp. RSA 1358]KAJ2681117.1 hypothetical protein GGI25_000072 [Coemansia spiralis]
MHNADGGFVECGGCTQMAVFVRLLAVESGAKDAQGLKAADSATLRLLASIVFPVYNKPRLVAGELEQMVLGMTRCVADAQGVFLADDLWAALGARQQFRRRAALEAWLQACPACTATAASDACNACYVVDAE